MPATRLLVVADSKMLSALANGLREGGAFEVAVASLAEPAAAQAAAAEAEAVVLFYGGPAAVQALAARLRDRGGRVVAVLQANQHPQRDDCFRAGASDLLFMPMPKDQFVSRLQQSCALNFESGAGAGAEVTAATRGATVKLEGAKVVPAGIESATAAPFKAGETVKLTFGPFQVWGLIAHAAEPLQIRFAGLTADEDAKIRKWIEAGGPAEAAAPAKPAEPAPAPAVESAAPAAEASAAPPEAAAPESDAPLITPRESPAAESGDGPRAAPSAGPPPGFADRKPVRASTRPLPQRGPPPILTPPSVAPVAPAPKPTELSASPEAAPSATAPNIAPPPPAAPEAAPAADARPALDLFDEAKPAEAAAAPAVPTGPLWPTLYSPQSCRTAALFVLQDKAVTDAPPAVAASARKVTGGLGSSEREGLQKAGSDSHFADALAARVALDAASTEGAKLYAAVPAPSVDAAAVATLMKLADDAATRLQKEANSAVTKGEVESLQLITSASAALSRDLLAFKETVDRLRGLEAAPRLGAGALDPHFAVPGQPLRTQSNKPVAKAPVRAELRDFTSLDGAKQGTWKKIAVGVASAVFLVLAANAFYFNSPQMRPIAPDAAGKNVQSIEVHSTGAIVVVTLDWIDNAQVEAPKLAEVLRERGVATAMLMTANGKPAGILTVQTGKILGLPNARKK